MWNSKTFIVFVVILSFEKYVNTYTIPFITFEAYSPRGFRASIPDEEGLQLFAFHGIVDQPINFAQQGDFSSDIRSAENNRFTYFNEELKLNVGDKVNYWVHVQKDKLGYRKNPSTWVVKELLPINMDTCNKSESLVQGKSNVCAKSFIFEDDFSDANINEDKWTIEHYIPQGPDYEFVSYQRQQCSIEYRKLYIKPVRASSDASVRGTLNLRPWCTRDSDDKCVYRETSGFILPPVTSGRMVSKTMFKYGEVVVRAVLPKGDWIYPEIYLEQVKAPHRKIWIAYARGNDALVSENNEDIGSRVLFGGPVLESGEPGRSTYLRTKRGLHPFSDSEHEFYVKWEPDRITLKIDGEEYGSINSNEMRDIKFSDNDMVRLVLGVGVGGINDFPDNYRSGTVVKPWINKEARQQKKFFQARNEWSKTWYPQFVGLRVVYVNITAL